MCGIAFVAGLAFAAWLQSLFSHLWRCLCARPLGQALGLVAGLAFVAGVAFVAGLAFAAGLQSLFSHLRRCKRVGQPASRVEVEVG